MVAFNHQLKQKEPSLFKETEGFDVSLLVSTVLLETSEKLIHHLLLLDQSQRDLFPTEYSATGETVWTTE
jgi:hypothetical protein